jgi:hypothetical protein
VTRRAVALLAALPLLVGACASEPRTTWVSPGAPAPQQTRQPPASSGPPPVAAGGALTGPVIINQSRTGPGERRLAVEPDGSWACDNCAGDGRNTTGRLTAAQLGQLRGLMADPAFGEEDGVPPSVPQCPDRLESNMTTSSGVVLWTNCRGGGPPPVSLRILRLLAGATPLDAGLPR